MNTAPEAKEAIYQWSITSSFSFWLLFALGGFRSINKFWFVCVDLLLHLTDQSHCIVGFMHKSSYRVAIGCLL